MGIAFVSFMVVLALAYAFEVMNSKNVDTSPSDQEVPE